MQDLQSKVSVSKLWFALQFESVLRKKVRFQATIFYSHCFGWQSTLLSQRVNMLEENASSCVKITTYTEKSEVRAIGLSNGHKQPSKIKTKDI